MATLRITFTADTEKPTVKRTVHHNGKLQDTATFATVAEAARDLLRSLNTSWAHEQEERTTDEALTLPWDD